MNSYKIKSYWNFIKNTAVYIPMMLLNWVFYWNVIYFNREWIRKNKPTNKLALFMWLFLNDTEKASEHDIDWGDYGQFSHNWYGACRQNMGRNFFWNLRINYLTPKKADMTKKVGTESVRMFNNSKPLILGYTNIYFPSKDGTEWYFRKSKGDKLPFSFKWRGKLYTHYCYQFGVSSSRYILKFHLISK